jgi:hypothetical protein
MSVEGHTLYDVKQIRKLENIYTHIYRQFILNYFVLGL